MTENTRTKGAEAKSIEAQKAEQTISAIKTNLVNMPEFNLAIAARFYDVNSESSYTNKVTFNKGAYRWEILFGRHKLLMLKSDVIGESYEEVIILDASVEKVTDKEAVMVKDKQGEQRQIFEGSEAFAQIDKSLQDLFPSLQIVPNN